MILITGAAGKTGRALIQALSDLDVDTRALVHRPEQTRTVEAVGAREVQAGDLTHQAVLDRAVSGVRAVYHIPPNLSPDEISIGQAIIQTARAAEVEHFVYHSVLHPQSEAMPHHWLKLRVEELIFESGLPFTILQPAAYMQNILAQWVHIKERGVYPVPYPIETRLSLVDLNDVAKAAALVLTESGHTGATYELVGAQALTQIEIAEILSLELGKSVRAITIPLDDWERGVRNAGLGNYQVETLLNMFQYYKSYGLIGSPRVLGWLLGRTPTSFQEFSRRMTGD